MSGTFHIVKQAHDTKSSLYTETHTHTHTHRQRKRRSRQIEEIWRLRETDRQTDRQTDRSRC